MSQILFSRASIRSLNLYFTAFFVVLLVDDYVICIHDFSLEYMILKKKKKKSQHQE